MNDLDTKKKKITNHQNKRKKERNKKRGEGGRKGRKGRKGTLLIKYLRTILVPSERVRHPTIID